MCGLSNIFCYVRVQQKKPNDMQVTGTRKHHTPFIDESNMLTTKETMKQKTCQPSNVGTQNSALLPPVQKKLRVFDCFSKIAQVSVNNGTTCLMKIKNNVWDHKLSVSRWSSLAVFFLQYGEHSLSLFIKIHDENGQVGPPGR